MLQYVTRVLDQVDRENACAVVPLVWHDEIAGKLLKRLRAHRLSVDSFARAERYFTAMALATDLNAYTVPRSPKR